MSPSRVLCNRAQFYQSLGATMIYGANNLVEAMTKADRSVVLDKRIVQKVGAPPELNNHPANLFVIGFTGASKMNLIKISVARA
jgi:multiple sugar transport system ATP-binding protein